MMAQMRRDMMTPMLKMNMHLHWILLWIKNHFFHLLLSLLSKYCHRQLWLWLLLYHRWQHLLPVPLTYLSHLLFMLLPHLHHQPLLFNLCLLFHCHLCLCLLLSTLSTTNSICCTPNVCWALHILKKCWRKETVSCPGPWDHSSLEHHSSWARGSNSQPGDSVILHRFQGSMNHFLDIVQVNNESQPHTFSRMQHQN